MGYTSSLYQMEVVIWYLFGQDKQRNELTSLRP